MISSGVFAGFPSPADNYLDDELDLNDFLITKPAATFLERAIRKSMTEVGIYDSDALVVDRSEKALDRSIIIACIGGEFLIERLRINLSIMWLEAAHPNYQSIHIGEHIDFAI